MSRRPPPPASRPVGGFVTALGALTVVAYGSWYYGFGVLLTDIARDLGAAEKTLALGFGLAHLSSGVLGIAAGRALDRHGPRPVFLAGAVGAVLLAVSASAPNGAVFCLVFGAGGGMIGASGFYPVTQTVTARCNPGAEVRAIARLTVWGAFASPIFIPATEFARRTWGWQTTIRLAAGAAGAACLAAALALRRAPAPSAGRIPRGAAALRHAVADTRIRRLTASAMLTAGAVSILLLYQVPLMVAAGLGAGTASAFAGARGLAQLLGRLPLAGAVDRLGPFVTLRTARAGLALSCVLILLSGHVPVAIVFTLAAGTSIGAIAPLDGIAARTLLPPADLGALMGALALCAGLAAAAAPVLAASVVDLTGHHGAAALLAALCAGAAAVILPRAPRADEPA